MILGAVCWGQVGCAEDEPPAPAATQATTQAQPPDSAPNPGSALDASPPPARDTATAQAPEHLQVVDLEDIKNLVAETASDDRVLVIDFWATWCVPCVEMFAELHGGLVGLGERVRAVTVTLDDPSREADAIAFLSGHAALTDAYIFVSDSAAQQALVDGLGRRWNNLSVPAILVYDPGKGLVGEFLEGGTAPQIIELVDTLLASDQEDQP